MKTIDEVIKAFEWCINNDSYECDECPYDKEEEGCHHRNLDALHYLKEYRVVTDICHKHGIASVWGQVLPDPEKTDWDKKLNFDNAYDNDPLDWETLKQMEGKPVWIEWISGCGKGSKKWVLSHGCDDLMMVFTALDVAKVGYDGHLRQISLGKTWQAYRKERG